VGDIIVTVDGSAVSSNLDAAVGSIRGIPGTSVQLGIESEEGSRRQLTVARAAITVRKPGRHR
jgi:C-terminal processing protease CtpA/Prc